MSAVVDVIADTRCQLGEAPLWSARDNAIYWVDILAPALHRYSLATTQLDRWPMPEKIGWVVERQQQPGFIAGFQSGFAALTLDPVACARIVDPEPQLPDNRFNDASVDPWGRIWAGTMDCDIRSATSSLYRLDADFTVSCQDSGYLVTNGPAFDGVARCVYHSDTARRIVYRFDVAEDGEISGKRTFIRFPEAWGEPDGMTVDAEGGLWIAHWGGGRVSRFDRDGRLDRQISLPTSQITSCTFGGVDLDRLFVTSAAVGQTGEMLAGALFEIDPQGIRGLSPGLFVS